MSDDTILFENRQYWTGRAAGYSEVNREELATEQREKWRRCLKNELENAFPDRALTQLRVLEVGTGPGFFAILLRELGCAVTAVDLTPAMLDEARRNAGALAGEICFLEMNAQALSFPDASFDAVVSRNLTWNLPRPGEAYRQWARVLCRGGLLLNFDANWYRYLFQEDARAAYDADRARSAEQGLGDQNVGADFDVCEDIARRVPLSRLDRPAWDLETLRALGLAAEADTEIWKSVWSAQEKVNFASTPLFLLRARKADAEGPAAG